MNKPLLQQSMIANSGNQPQTCMGMLEDHVNKKLGESADNQIMQVFTFIRIEST
jgi:hypothetical protein